MLNQLKMAQQLMKNMSPDEIQNLMKQAQESKKMFAEEVKKAVDEEIAKRSLVSREDVEKMIQARLS